jgi:hypothetical protein
MTANSDRPGLNPANEAQNKISPKPPAPSASMSAMDSGHERRSPRKIIEATTCPIKRRAMR